MTEAALFKEKGYVILDPAKVLEDVKAFYLDIARYLAIILWDDERFREYSECIRKSLATDDVFLVDKAIQTALEETQKIDRKVLGKLYDMGTRPNKFLSGERLFFNNEVKRITDIFFASKGAKNPLLVKPNKGETLHLFTPGESQFKYNLPIHQDYQYLGQSSEQLTFWLFLSGDKDTGGLRVYPGTHLLGPVECTVNEYGHHEVNEFIKARLENENSASFGGELFQLLAIDSLLLHQSLKSDSASSSRLTYIWRISNIESANRTKFAESF